MSNEPTDINPYAPPSVTEGLTVVPLTFEQALERVQRPARMLVYVSLLNLFANSLMLLLMPWTPSDPSLSAPPPLWARALITTVATGLPLLAFIAALRVRPPRPIVWSWIAIITSLIPIGTGCWFLQLALGLWLLHLLVKPEIRAALKHPRKE
jgi:hypothetical protein